MLLHLAGELKYSGNNKPHKAWQATERCNSTKPGKVTDFSEGEIYSSKFLSSPGSPIINTVIFPAWSHWGQGLVRGPWGPHLPREHPPPPRAWRAIMALSPWPTCRVPVCPKWHQGPTLSHPKHHPPPGWVKPSSLVPDALPYSAFSAKGLRETQAQGHRAVPRPILFIFDSIKLWPFGLFPN